MSPLMYLKSLGYQQNVKTNGVWTKTTVKSILTNQAYIGSAVHGKVVIEKYNNIPLHATDPSEWVIVKNTYEPLVDKEPFEKAQERVKKISDAYFAKEFTKHPPNEKNLLKGKIVCGDCGKGMRLLQEQKNRMYIFVELFQMVLIRHVQDTKLIRRMSTKLSLLRFQIICVAVLTH